MQINRFIVSCMIKKSPVGAVFTKWPLHLTIVPWFLYEGDVNELIERMKQKLKDIRPFKIQVGDQKMFGPNRDVPVKLVDKNVELTKLHSTIYHLLLSSGTQPEREEYNTAVYTPHITVRGDRNIASGEIVTIDSVDILRDLQDGHMSRQIIKRIMLKN